MKLTNIIVTIKVIFERIIFIDFHKTITNQTEHVRVLRRRKSDLRGEYDHGFFRKQF